VGGLCLGGRYRMGALLATGGMGEVWAAHDLLLDRPVAVKVLGGALADDGRAAERLRREARAAGRLEHPSIARVLDLGEHDGRPYLVMELLEGESLAARIDRAGPMPPAEAARVVAAVAEALEAAHQAGVVHRDVKPGNVFLTSTGAVKVLDFGIASAAGDAALTTGDLLGTAAYLAPERVLGHRATPAADIYALGVVLYELLAGHRPFDGGSEVELAMAHVNADPPSLLQAAPSAPPFVAAACHQALAKDPSARPASAAHLATLVRGPGRGAGATRPLPLPASVVPAPATGPVSPAPVPAPQPRSGRRPRPRRRGLLVALLLAGALLAALPGLAGGLPLLGPDRVDGPIAVLDPGTTPSNDGVQAPLGTGADPPSAANPGPAAAAASTAEATTGTRTTATRAGPAGPAGAPGEAARAGAAEAAPQRPNPR